MLIYTWAKRWGVPMEAVTELRAWISGELRQAETEANTEVAKSGSESRQSSLVRLEAARADILLFRNNVGALKDKGGRVVRFGLANDSKQFNETYKSGDLIGCRKKLITLDMVGQSIGQFVSREIKKQDWVPCWDEHETAQLNWANLINAYGGDAKFCSGPGSFDL